MMIITHPCELALIGANEDISLTIQLRLPGVFELLLLRDHREPASMEKEQPQIPAAVSSIKLSVVSNVLQIGFICQYSQAALGSIAPIFPEKTDLLALRSSAHLLFVNYWWG